MSPGAILPYCLRAPLGGLTMMVACLGMFVSTEEVRAQGICWDCETIYWPGDDCFIDSCWWTNSAGESSCSQYGQCGDLDTCDTGGHGCEGPTMVLLDGRSVGGISLIEAGTILSKAESDVLARFVRSAEGGTEILRLSCNGALVHVTYSPDESARLRRLTGRFSL